MVLSVKEARALLGADAARLSDQEICQRCRELEDLTRLIVGRFDRERREQMAESREARGAA